MRYEFETAGKIVVGPGCTDSLESLLDPSWRRLVLVTGRGTLSRGGPAATLAQGLLASSRVALHLTVGGEPEIPQMEAAALQARGSACQGVIGLGGGSVLDAAKAVAALTPQPEGALYYLEVVGQGRPLHERPLPVVAMPTTAGTGSEVTRNAVLLSPDHQVKASLRHAWMLPRLALVDSRLTLDLPPAVTASSGLDALAQLLEPYVCLRAQPMTDGFCLEGLSRVAFGLRRAYHRGDDEEAREAMSTASLLGGLALANAGLGAIHGIAAPLGGGWKIAHGAACAALMPGVTRANIRALKRQDPHHPTLARYARAAEVLLGRGGDTQALLEGLLGYLRDLKLELGIPRLGSLGLSEAALPGLAAAAARASSTKANPVPLSEAELVEAIAEAL